MDIALKEAQQDRLIWHQRVQDVLRMALLIQMKSTKPFENYLVRRRYLRTSAHGIAKRLELSVFQTNVSFNLQVRNHLYA